MDHDASFQYENIGAFLRKLEREMKSGLVSLLILRVIKDSLEPVYGYKIIMDLKKSTNSNLILKEGSVYPILHYLESQNFVLSYLDGSPTGAPRKYYNITKLGEMALEAGMSSWSEFKELLDSIFIIKEV
ncbi:MAG: PadR family transcriptional regulator [Candidatus Thermoplasmatota archaeon]|nr:PadR family transcriptional regulator [Candidatus Thermoplasmatota archaeon]